MLTLRDTQESLVNGAVVPLPVRFLSGPNRGSFYKDSLFVAGSTGWQTSAVKDGALQRVRWTGKRFLQPIGWHARSTGLEMTFAEPLRRDTAEEVGSYSVKRWNYRYAEEYGSKEWSVEHPDRPGRDEVQVSAARLTEDGCRVILTFDPVGPVMQFEVKYNLDTPDGKAVKGSFWGSLKPNSARL